MQYVQTGGYSVVTPSDGAKLSSNFVSKYMHPYSVPPPFILGKKTLVGQIHEMQVTAPPEKSVPENPTF